MMGYPVFIPAMFRLMCITTLIMGTSSQQSAQYFFYQNSEYPKDCKDVQRQCSTSNSSGVYFIKPDGFREPFEVFCSNNADKGGWTVIHRREDGLVNFNRTWSQYKEGFGFLSTEFWLGNEKVAFLTNQGDYELLVKGELSNGHSFVTTYQGFRITDEFGNYELRHIGEYGCEECPNISECPAGVFFKNGCTQKCVCDNNGLDCTVAQCGTNAACIDIGNGAQNCSCNEGYVGNGETCTATTTERESTTIGAAYKDCMDVYNDQVRHSGVYPILPDGWTSGPFNVYCEMDNDGGWTVFQRRRDGTPVFDQSWDSYKAGFGDITDSFWLGNDKLYYLTNQKDYKLRFDVTTTTGDSYYAEYTEFQIESESTNYTMNKLGSHSGTTGNVFSDNQGKQFSTHDRDNDACNNFNCAEGHRSGWWHSDINCSACSTAWCSWFQYSDSCHTICTGENLNGVYNGGNGERIFTSSSCSVQNVEMKIRP